MDQGKKYRIKEIADLFHLPVSTLHYWEKEGLLRANRMDNKYRVFESRDFFDIWEINLYRNLQVSIQELKMIKDKDPFALEELLMDQRNILISEIEEKQRILNKLEGYQKGFEVWEELKCNSEKEFTFEEPDIEMLVKDPFTPESMKQTIANPQDCCVYFSKETGFAPVMAIPTTRESKLNLKDALWKKNSLDCVYIIQGIRSEYGRLKQNDIHEKIEIIQSHGYHVQQILSRYLFTATEAGKRYDYYKAWFGIV